MRSISSLQPAAHVPAVGSQRRAKWRKHSLPRTNARARAIHTRASSKQASQRLAVHYEETTPWPSARQSGAHAQDEDALQRSGREPTGRDSRASARFSQPCSVVLLTIALGGSVGCCKVGALDARCGATSAVRPFSPPVALPWRKPLPRMSCNVHSRRACVRGPSALSTTSHSARPHTGRPQPEYHTRIPRSFELAEKCKQQPTSDPAKPSRQRRNARLRRGGRAARQRGGGAQLLGAAHAAGSTLERHAARAPRSAAVRSVRPLALLAVGRRRLRVAPEPQLAARHAMTRV